jgi:glutathione S-transferase
MIEALEALEAELGGKDYFGGEDLGFLDVALAPFTSWFRTYEQCGGFAVAEHCPGLAAWADRCRGRDAVASALTDPDKVYEFALTLKNKFGDK